MLDVHQVMTVWPCQCHQVQAAVSPMPVNSGEATTHKLLLLHRESKKTRHQTLGHNFTNYYPIFKIFSLADSEVNLQQIRV